MKSALRYIGVLFFVLVAAQTSVYGQDGPDNEQPIYDDKVYHEAPVGDMDGESDNKVLTPVTKSTSAKDSSSIRVTVPARVNNKQNQEPKDNKPQQQPQSGDDSILSFNFIYYIIQRFKLQDIIE